MLAGGLWVPVYGSTVGGGSLYGKGIFMPDMFGWTGAIVISLTILIAFYIFITRLETGIKAVPAGEISS